MKEKQQTANKEKQELIPDNSVRERELKLLRENEELRERLTEAEDALNAIRNGEVDAIIVSGAEGEKIFSLTSAETPYRFIIERMEEGAVTISEDGNILYCNPRFSSMVGLPSEQITGSYLPLFIEQSDVEKFKALLDLGIKGRGSGEFRLITASAQQEFCLFTVSPLPSEVPGEICVIISNITELKKFQHHLSWVVRERTLELEESNQLLRKDIERRIESEKRLRHSENVMNYFMSTVPVGVMRYRSPGTITYANERFLSMTGFTKQDVDRGRLNWINITPAEYTERDKEALEEYYATGKFYPYEKAFFRKDGSILPVMVSAVLVDAEIDEGICFIMDLSAIKLKEQELLHNEFILEETQRIGKLGGWEYDIIRNKVVWSKNLYNIYGKDPDQIDPTLEDFFELVHEDDREKIRKSLLFAINQGGTYQIEYRILVNGEVRHIMSRGALTRTSDGKPKALIGTSLDMTERVQREQQLRESEARARKLYEELQESEKKFRELVKYAPTAIYEIDFRTQRFSTLNDAMVELLGYSREELLEMNVLDVLTPDGKKRFMERVKNIRKGETVSESIEYEVLAKDGHIIEASLNVNFIYDEEGNIASARVVGHDITQRNKDKRELERAILEADLERNRIKALLQASPSAIIIIENPDGRVSFSNEQAKILYGIDPIDLSLPEHENILLLHLDGTRYVLEDRPATRTLLHGEVVKGEELIIQREDGTQVIVSVNTAPLYDNQGNILAVIGIFDDITERKKTEQELIEARNSAGDRRKRLEALYRIAPSAIFILDKEGKVTFANETAKSLYGFDISELELPRHTKAGVLKLDHTPFKAEELPASRSLLTGEIVTGEEVIIRRPDGSEVYVIVSTAPLRTPTGELEAVMGVFQDITASREDKQKLEDQAFLIDNAGDAIIATDELYRITYWNKGAEKTYGWTAAEAIGKIGPELLKTQFLEGTREEAIRIAEEKGENETMIIHEHKDGHHLFIDSTFSVLKDRHGKVTNFISINRDITERKKMEESLREKEKANAIMASIIESSTTAIGFSTIDGKLIFANRALQQLTGYEKEELQNIEWNKLLTAPEDRARELQLKEKLLATGTSIRYEKSYITKEGKKVPVEVLMSFTRDENGKPDLLYAFMNDITERRQNEENLHKLIRTLKAMQNSSQLMVHAKDEQKFLEDVCRIIVEDCGHELVWIGYKQNDNRKSIIPVAYSGFDPSYIKALGLTWAETERGMGPSGIAVRTGKVSICKNMETEQSFLPWKDEALKRGFKSSISLPLFMGDETFAVLVIYSRQIDAFTEDEQQLLMKLANDLAYGIHAIRINLALKQSKEDLEIKVEERTSLLQKTLEDLGRERRRFMDVLNMIPAYVVLISEDLEVVFSNKIFNETFGELSESEFKFLLQENHSEFIKIFERGQSRQWEYSFRDGKIFSISDFPFTDNDGSVLILEMGIDITEKRNIEKYVLSKILETEERDRRRFASDLHDDLGPTLSAIKLQLSLLSTETEEGSKNELLNICDLLLSEGIEKMRTLANNIMPSLIESYGFETSVKSFIHRTQKSGQLTFDFTSNMNGFRFDEETELHLYRIVTELITNTIKHSGATNVRVDLKLNSDALRVTYSDNGIGYDINENPMLASGIGLQNIQNRVNLIQGNIEFQVNNGKTVVVIVKPLVQ